MPKSRVSKKMAHNLEGARVHPNVKVRIPSPNYSYRTTPIGLIVVHITVSPQYEGIRDLQGIGNYFASKSSQVSAHICVDGEGQSARYVRDALKAWHCMSFNSPGLGMENIGMPGQHFSEAQYRENARWIAYWSVKHDLPIQVGKTSGLSVARKGVVTHASLGAAGGGHSDPGPTYDMDHVLREAKFFRKKILSNS